MSLKMVHYYAYSKTDSTWTVTTNTFGIYVQMREYIFSAQKPGMTGVPTKFQPITGQYQCLTMSHSSYKRLASRDNKARGYMLCEPVVSISYGQDQQQNTFNVGSGPIPGRIYRFQRNWNNDQNILGDLELSSVTGIQAGGTNNKYVNAKDFALPFDSERIWFPNEFTMIKSFTPGQNNTWTVTKAYYRVEHEITTLSERIRFMIKVTEVGTYTESWTSDPASYLGLVDSPSAANNFVEVQDTVGHDEYEPESFTMANMEMNSGYVIGYMFKQFADVITNDEDNIENEVVPAIEKNAEDIEALKEDIGSSDLASTFVSL